MPNDPHFTHDERLVYRMPDLVKTVGLSKTTIYGLMKQNKFPHPIQITEKSVAWRAEDVRAWLAARPDATITESAIKRREVASRGGRRAALPDARQGY